MPAPLIERSRAGSVVRPIDRGNAESLIQSPPAAGRRYRSTTYAVISSPRSRLEVPVDRALGLVGAERACSHGVFEVPPEVRVGLGDLLDAIADAPRHRGSSTLGGAAQRARS